MRKSLLLIVISTYFVVLLVGPGLVFGGEKCVDEFKKSDMAGMLVGIGESGTYAEAKNAALADAISALGTKLTAKTRVIEGGAANDTYIDRSIESVTDALVKGAKTLSSCQEGGSYKITIGISKSLIAQLISAHSEQRVEWIKRAALALSNTPTPAIVKQYREGYAKVLNEEKDDLDSWLVLGRPRELFKEIPSDLRQDLERKLSSNSAPTVKAITIRANDDIARRTLPSVVNRLAADGVTATVDEGKGSKYSVWQCDMVKGMPVGQAIRFEVNCLLSQPGYDFQPVTVQGISVEGTLQDQAVRLVTQRLQSR